MIYGITGHQERDGIDWTWVRERIDDELRGRDADLVGLSSLARGADQVFADAVLRFGGRLTAIIPVDDYESCFDGSALTEYRRLLSLSQVVAMPRAEDDEAAFLAAGLRVSDGCDVLIAVWDGEGSRGSGGTADVVAHALATGRRIVHLQPLTREVGTLS